MYLFIYLEIKHVPRYLFIYMEINSTYISI